MPQRWAIESVIAFQRLLTALYLCCSFQYLLAFGVDNTRRHKPLPERIPH